MEKIELNSIESINSLIEHIAVKFPIESKVLSLYHEKESVLGARIYSNKIANLLNLIIDKNTIIANFLLIDSDIIHKMNALTIETRVKIKSNENSLNDMNKEIELIQMELSSI